MGPPGLRELGHLPGAPSKGHSRGGPQVLWPGALTLPDALQVLWDHRATSGLLWAQGTYRHKVF